MSIEFVNLQALWLLAGVLPLIAIYFLRARPQHYLFSGFFLLPQKIENPPRLRKLQKFIPEPSFWFQLLALLALVGALLGPEIVFKRAVVAVGILLDSSISLYPFHSEIVSAVDSEIAERAKEAEALDIEIREVHARGRLIYSGQNAADAKRALAGWRPVWRREPLAQGLKAFGSDVQSAQNILVVTDDIDRVPGSVPAAIIGRPVENVGFLGGQVKHTEKGESWSLTTLVRNYTKVAVTRELTKSIKSNDGTPASSEVLLTIPPLGQVLVQQIFPSTVTEVSLMLPPDEFRPDDAFEVSQPKAPPLKVLVDVDPRITGDTKKLLIALGAIQIVADEKDADLLVSSVDYGFGKKTPSNKPQILFYHSDAKKGVFVSGAVLPEADSRADGLSWQGLLPSPGLAEALMPNSQIILRAGALPLIAEGFGDGSRPSARSLQILFDPALSNVFRFPAFLVLAQRFVQAARGDLYTAGLEILAAGSETSLALKNVPTQIRLDLPKLSEQDGPGGLPSLNVTNLPTLLLPLPALPGTISVTPLEKEPFRIRTIFSSSLEVEFVSGISREDELQLAEIQRKKEAHLRQSLGARNKNTTQPLTLPLIILAGAFTLLAWLVGKKRDLHRHSSENSETEAV